ncbi:MAG: glycosyltransferase family 4 protein [Candidatus Sumerlaeia bacterium]
MTESKPHERRILMLATGRVVEPLFGGELRYFHLADELARMGHTVELHGWLSRNHKIQTARHGRLTIVEHHAAALDLAQVFHRLRLIPACELPAWLAHLGPVVAEMVKRNRFDIVHYELPWWSRAVDDLPPKTVVVYGAQNIESVWWEPRLKGFFRAETWKRRLLEHERHALTSTAGVVACSEQDAQWMDERVGVRPPRLAIVPNGFDARRFTPPDGSRRAWARRKFNFNDHEKVTVFIGAAVEHNVRAAREICERIAPATEGEAIRHVIAGRVARGMKCGRANVSCIENVSDVLELLQAADVAINPMLSGSGSNIKIAEALGAGLPVVTTEFGMRGYEAYGAWLGVGSIEDFPELIRKAQWPNPAPREEVERLGWAASARKLSEHYENLIKLMASQEAE